MDKKFVTFLSLALLCTGTPRTFSMQVPLDQQQLDAVAQNFKMAVKAAKPYNLWAEITRDTVVITAGSALMMVSRNLLKTILIRLARKAWPEVYITFGTLVSLGAALAIKGVYDICTINTMYEATRQVARVYPPFILMQLLNHPELQDDTTHQALKDVLAGKN